MMYDNSNLDVQEEDPLGAKEDRQSGLERLIDYCVKQ